VWIVVGLGNPGREYAETRHNIGFMVVDELARRAGLRLRRGRGDFDAAEARFGSTKAWLIQPLTFVNRSGRALTQFATTTSSFTPGEMLVVVDDVALPFGRLRLRPSGSAGGHNGLKSLVETLGTQAFPRLRLGVGAPEGEVDLSDHVLGRFSKAERRQLPDLVNRGADAVILVLESGPEAAIPRINAPPPPGMDP
jgi:PTH1 family peptidyl-tRNA hydrolase